MLFITCAKATSWQELPVLINCFCSLLVNKLGTFYTTCFVYLSNAQCTYSHPGQLSQAIPSWVSAMSTSQRVVMPFGWGVKAGMVRVWVAGKTVWSPCNTRAISERFRDKELIYKALYKFAFFTLLLHVKCVASTQDRLGHQHYKHI